MLVPFITCLKFCEIIAFRRWFVCVVPSSEYQEYVIILSFVLDSHHCAVIANDVGADR
jgi:hypothetical protein